MSKSKLKLKLKLGQLKLKQSNLFHKNLLILIFFTSVYFSYGFDQIMGITDYEQGSNHAKFCDLDEEKCQNIQILALEDLNLNQTGLDQLEILVSSNINADSDINADSNNNLSDDEYSLELLYEFLDYLDDKRLQEQRFRKFFYAGAITSSVSTVWYFITLSDSKIFPAVIAISSGLAVFSAIAYFMMPVPGYKKIFN